MTEESLFAAVLEQSTPAERASLLDTACGSNVELRRRVEQLLAADGKARGILDRAGDTPTIKLGDFVAEGPGTVIDNYELKELIGEGGFGLVFAADQRKPVRRTVALKIIKPGMDTREIITRFEMERQALAVMDHPNIARVFDAGATASGRPYFVMELVRGIAITTFCDHQKFTLRERLDLFRHVCLAVQHAHQKGIIHRDLKPLNVLVAEEGGRPHPKVIDFGIAKALHHDLTDNSLHTGFARMIGTPTYMSPEQAAMLDVDTRADIYSLGVLLYELLTGTTPFDRERLKGASLDELRRIIQDEDPEKPSARLAAVPDTRAQVAANRQIEPTRLVRSLRGELDWIVMKALEKDRTRRYESAASFARDIERYLGHEPVEACSPSTAYRIRKFIQRHRGPVIAAAVMVLLLVGGMIGTSLGLLEAKDAQEKERNRANAQDRERQRAEKAESDAKAALEEAKATLNFLLTDLLGQATSRAQAKSGHVPDPQLTVRAALDRAAAAVGTKFRDRPHLEAAIRKTLGDAYQQLGRYDEAILQFKAALTVSPQADEDHDIQVRLALTYREARKTDEAIALMEKIRTNQLERLGPEHVRTLITLNNLAAAYYDAGRHDDAIDLLKQVSDARSRTLGKEDPSTLTALSNLAGVYREKGRFPEAIATLEQVRSIQLKVLAPDHPDTLPTLQNLAASYWKTKQLDKSIPLLEQIWKVHRRIHGDDLPETIGAAANLGVNYRDANRMEEAIPLLEQADRAGRKFAALKYITRELLIAYERAGKRAEGLALVHEMAANARQSMPSGSPQLAAALAQAGSDLIRVKAWSEAEAVLREALAIHVKTSPDTLAIHTTQSMLGEALTAQAKYAEAEPLLLESYEGFKKRTPPTSKARPDAPLTRIIRLYEAWNKPEEAAKWRAEQETPNSTGKRNQPREQPRP